MVSTSILKYNSTLHTNCGFTSLWQRGVEVEGGFRAEVEEEVKDAEVGNEAESVCPHLIIWSHRSESAEISLSKVL